MFVGENMPSSASIFSAYTTFAASAMMARTVLSEVQTMTSQIIPEQLKEGLLSKLGNIFGNCSSQVAVTIDEYKGYSVNELYQASEIYLSSIMNPSVRQLKASKTSQDNDILVTMDKGQKMVDVYEGIELHWQFLCSENQKSFVDYESLSTTTANSVTRSFQLTFHKGHKKKVLNSYLPFVVERSNAIREQNKVVKLYSLGSCGGPWESINLDHPSTFDTLAMDPIAKEELMDDLDRFLKRRKFYRRVGKAWKRGYLLYGPPGTGKSSLIAAMANYLKFDIYDLELTSLHCNSDLRRLLVSTSNRSIIVIEDIDCGMDLQNRENENGYCNLDRQFTLSGLLNFIDGLWSCCGDERMIIFTTNFKEKLDPALLRPGRMDKHIHMSYLAPSGFKILAYNYHGLRSHILFSTIEDMLREVEVTPAEVAEELMKREDADTALGGLVEFLRKKRKRCDRPIVEHEAIQDEKIFVESVKNDEENLKKVTRCKRKMPRKGRSRR